MLPARTALLVSIAIGAALEVGVTLATGRREAWDAGVYWSTGLPLAVLASAAVGYLSQGRAWLATALIVPAQVATMMVRGGEAGNLWPLTLVLSSALSLPFVGVAFAARRMRRRP
jgi:hypothetical protein